MGRGSLGTGKYLSFVRQGKPPRPMSFLFQTKRLRCRRWTRADFNAVYAIYSDPVAMQWVGEGRPITREACETWFAVTEANYQTRGYGMFALDDPATGLMVGCCGLIHPGGQPEAEIKYAFLREHWAKGLASEVVPALLQYGYEEHGLGRIIATVYPENLVSQRTLLKAGARVVQHRTEDDGTATLVFERLASSAA